MRIGIVLSLCVALVTAGAVATALAGIPQLVNYQGILQDSNGDPITTPVSVEFSIYNVASGGTAVWTETRDVEPDADGRFSILLGEVSPVLDTVFFAANRWLGIKVGSDAEMDPRTRLASVGYAYRVSSIDGAAGGVITGFLEVNGFAKMNGQVLIPVSPGTPPIQTASTTTCTNVNADLLDGYHAGNASGQVPVSNGTVNTDLNADKLDGVEQSKLLYDVRRTGRGFQAECSMYSDGAIVTFSEPFSANPVVVATPQDPGVIVSIQSWSAISFMLRLINHDGTTHVGSVYVHWIAIGSR